MSQSPEVVYKVVKIGNELRTIQLNELKASDFNNPHSIFNLQSQKATLSYSRVICQNVNKCNRLLLLGIGGGAMLPELMTLAKNIDAVDVSQDSINICKSILKLDGPKSKDKIKYILADARTVVVDPKCPEYDVIICDIFSTDESDMPWVTETPFLHDCYQKIRKAGGKLFVNTLVIDNAAERRSRLLKILAKACPDSTIKVNKRGINFVYSVIT